MLSSGSGKVVFAGLMCQLLCKRTSPPSFPGKFLLHLTKCVVQRKGKPCYWQNLKQLQHDYVKKTIYSSCGTAMLTVSFYCGFYGWCFSRYMTPSKKARFFYNYLDLGISLGVKPPSHFYDAGTFSS